MDEVTARTEAQAARRALILLLLLDAAAIAVGIALGAARGKIKHEFSEHGLMTWVSCLQLVAVSAVCWKVLVVRRGEAPLLRIAGPHFVWLLFAGGFAFLALDEGFEVHEHMDKLTHRALALSETTLTDRIDDAIVLAYGLVGIGVLWWQRRELARYRGALPATVAGFVLLFAMVGMDAFANSRTVVIRFFGDAGLGGRIHPWLIVAEESLKVLGEAVFLAAAYRCLLIARRLAVAEGVSSADPQASA